MPSFSATALWLPSSLINLHIFLLIGFLVFMLDILIDKFKNSKKKTISTPINFYLNNSKIVLDKAKPKNYTIEKHRGESKTPTRESKK